MPTKRKLAGAVIAIYILLAGAYPAQACMGNPFPRKHRIKHATLSNIRAEIEIDGLVAFDSESASSCATAVQLPEGLIATAVSVLDAESDEPVGFGQFRADARARRGFCGQGSTNCVAFISRVTQQVKAGTPLKMIIEVLSEDVLDARQLTNLAVRVARSSVFVVGGVDNDGLPHDHLSVFRPNGIEIVFLDEPKTDPKKDY